MLHPRLAWDLFAADPCLYRDQIHLCNTGRRNRKFDAWFYLSSCCHFQTATLKVYPEQPTVVFFFCVFGTLQCVIYSAIFERSLDAWVMLPSIGVIAIVFSAVCGTVFRANVISWCLEKKGPLYVAVFKPMGVIIAAIMEILFLGSPLHLGSVIGAIISSVGFYTVLWGQAKEKAMIAFAAVDHESKSLVNRAPLLK
ncbi:unnamed protein product [Cuscuta epithymum]|uniref:WAT1-related protein n=1 Tax=Cuscuta epithymum TaxID=186058 RepID=A0AAV0EKS6_9ASTE|nr:unnamed protein product [Cuscuta epithymum]